MKSKALWFMTAVFAVCSFPCTASSPSAEERVVLGYYPAWVRNSFPAEKNDFSTLSHVIHAFAWPDSNGELAFWKDFHYPELVESAHRGDAKISVALGGWGQCEGFPPMTADPELRKKFIGNILDYCVKNGYDGVDIDWEFPANSTERNNQTIFIRELREAADKLGNPFLITMAVSAGTWSSDHNDYAALKEYLDFFNVMTYDFHGSWTPRAGHNAPLFGSQESVDASIRFIVREMGVPSEKVVLGLPFYGRTFNATSLYGLGSGGGALNYREIVKRIAEGGWNARFDDVSQVPYLMNDANSAYIFYDDPDSIMRKCNYALENKLKGVMIWALGSDYTGDGQPLLDAIGKVMGERSK